MGQSFRPDFLQECMAPFGNVQIDVFNKEFCVVCANRECSRSAANNSVFDRRVSSWRQRLFQDVPRAGEDDPAFSAIRAKRFLPIGIQEARAPTLVMTAPEITSPEPVPAPVQEPDPAMSVQEPAHQEPARRPEPARGPVVPAVQNTPFQQGAVIGTGEGKDVFMQPGQSFTFGGSDGEPDQG